jgi:hypothetical protein
LETITHHFALTWIKKWEAVDFSWLINM